MLYWDYPSGPTDPNSRLRAVIKAVTYRAWQSLNTFLIALLFTGNFETAAQIVSLEVVVKLVVYYLHERIWSRLDSKKSRFVRKS